MNPNRATQYSARVALYLAERYRGPAIPSSILARETGIPRPFLVKLLQPLVRAGVVCSLQGAQGGFRLARDPAELTLLDVLRAVDEPMALNICLTSGDACDRAPTCPVHDLWKNAADALEEIFARRTLAELTEGRELKRIF